MLEEKAQEGVQKEEGKPEDKEQASASPEQADSNGVITIDVTKKYRSKRRPDVEVAGDDLWSNYGRGLQYSKVESENQKLQAQRDADAGKLAEQAEQIAQFKTNERLVKAMKDAGIGATGQKPVAPQAEDWLTLGEEQNDQTLVPRANPNEIASRIDDFEAEMRSRLSPEKQEQILRDEAARLYSIEQEKRNAQEAVSNADAKIRSARLAELKISLPDISEDALASIVDADGEYIRHALDATQLLQQGETQVGIETFLDGLEKQRSIHQKELDLMQQQAKITAENERLAELETLSTGSLPGEKPEEERKRIYDWHAAEKAQEVKMQEIHKQMDRQKLLKNTGM